MKFSDGYWSMRADHTPYYAAEVHEVEVRPDAMVVYAPTKHLGHRGDTLNLPLLTVEFSSPMPNVIKVRLSHLQGGLARKPQFELFPQAGTPLEIREDEQAAVLRSGDLAVRVHKQGGWRVEFTGGERTLTSSGWHAMGFVDTPRGALHPRAAGSGCGRMCLRAGRALHRLCQKRPGDRSVE